MLAIKATYQNGVFTPQQPVDLADGAKVTLWVDSADSNEVDHLRDEDREFLSRLAKERSEVFKHWRNKHSMVYPTFDFLIELHTYLMRDVWHESYYGPFRADLLQSALARPRQAAGYEAADAIRQAAYLFHGILMNHGFVQGNKRTAYAILEWFLSQNQLGKLTASDDEIISFCYAAENLKWSVNEVESWLRPRVAAEAEN